MDSRAADAVTSLKRSDTSPLSSRRRAGFRDKELRMGSFKKSDMAG